MRSDCTVFPLEYLSQQSYCNLICNTLRVPRGMRCSKLADVSEKASRGEMTSLKYSPDAFIDDPGHMTLKFWCSSSQIKLRRGML
jgi:hypothetical protein